MVVKNATMVQHLRFFQVRVHSLESWKWNTTFVEIINIEWSSKGPFSHLHGNSSKHIESSGPVGKGEDGGRRLGEAGIGDSQT